MTPDDEALLARLPDSARSANGVPTSEDISRRERAAALAEIVLGDALLSQGLRVSPLGPGWSSDIDAHVHPVPLDARLRSAGWLCLDGLLRSIGSPGTGRWAVIEGGEVLGAVDLHRCPVPDRAAAILKRALKRRQVRIREVLELRALLRAGASLPPLHPVLAVAADVEAGLGGDVLAAWRTGSPCDPPAPLRHRRWAVPLVAVRRRARPRFVVACSGVDGAGKSSLALRLVADLGRVGVPAELVWTRPGMLPGPLHALGASAKRLLRHSPDPALRTVATGTSAERLPSRRGLLGWLWALAVTASFLFEVHRRHLFARGVVVYDRHLIDALATLDFAYDGVNLSLPRLAVRRILPGADLTLLLLITPELAVARKPGDVIGEHAVRRQLESYGRDRGLIKNLHVLEAQGAASDLASAAFALVVGGSASGHSADADDGARSGSPSGGAPPGAERPLLERLLRNGFGR